MLIIGAVFGGEGADGGGVGHFICSGVLILLLLLLFDKLDELLVSNEDYNVCINAWKDNNMKTFKDFLEWYNNLDVLPFIEAVEKMKDFYKLKKVSFLVEATNTNT